MSRRALVQQREALATAEFRSARDQLLDSDRVKTFKWPALSHFNWARDWFDVVARDSTAVGLWIAGPDGDTPYRLCDLSERSDRLASWFQTLGLRPGDRLMVLLNNGAALYETLLAAIKRGLVVIPCHIPITASEFTDRVARGAVDHVIAASHVAATLPERTGVRTWIAHGPAVPGWYDLSDGRTAAVNPNAQATTRGNDPLYGYFTSGTTSRPKLVLHSHTSYPVGHLSSMYWNGVRPGDVHLNVSPPGWAKHAWSSFFVPWNAEATIVALDAGEITASLVLAVMRRRRVTTFCAPPTVWRKLIAHGLGAAPAGLREAVSAGEPLSPEVAECVRDRWGIEVRDGYGQTETTAQIGNPPGVPVKPGSIGRPLPGYKVVLLDPDTGQPGRSGEICLDLRRPPAGLMIGYDGDLERTGSALGGRYYRTGDLAVMDRDGYITVLGRRDDIFKTHDVRISPYEIERALARHGVVGEVAIVPSPDPVGQWVPKAFVRLNEGHVDGPEAVAAIDRWQTEQLAPEKRVRRLAFVDALPKTVSGKIKRAQLRASEAARTDPTTALPGECFLPADPLEPQRPSA